MSIKYKAKRKNYIPYLMDFFIFINVTILPNLSNLVIFTNLINFKVPFDSPVPKAYDIASRGILAIKSTKNLPPYT